MSETPFGFAPVPSEEPQVPLSQPLPQEPSASSTEVSNILEVIGENTKELYEVPINLDGRQKMQIQMLSKQLFINGERITGEAIWYLWPKGLLSSGRVSSDITDQSERGKIFRAGPRPEIGEIQSFLNTDEYLLAMEKLGVEVDPNNNGLTVEQMGLLTVLSNPADGRDLKRKLSHAGITWNKYQAWLSQPVFQKHHNKVVSETLIKMMPIAKQQIAAKIAAGDTAMIKFGMEVTGEHDPARQKQIDTKAFLAIVFEVIEEEIKDSSILQRIGAKIALRGNTAIER